MPWGNGRSIRVLPGVRVNIGGSDAPSPFGLRRTQFLTGRRGVRETVSFDLGLSYTTEPMPSKQKSCCCLGLFLLPMLALAVMAIGFTRRPGSPRR
jgi:hypothetical protein